MHFKIGTPHTSALVSYLFFTYRVVSWLITFFSYSGVGGKWRDYFLAVACVGEEGAQSQHISEEKAGGCVTSQKITDTG